MVLKSEHNKSFLDIAGEAEYKEHIYFVGPANVGKSCLFSAITKKFAMVSNYPGTTVEITQTEFDGKLWIDTPGIYGLVPGSEEEAVAIRMLLENTDSKILLVLDARNLLRGISLFLALSELKHRFIIALNMHDEASDAGFDIDSAALGLILGVPVVPTVAVTRQGIRELTARFSQASYASLKMQETYSIETAISNVQKSFESETHSRVRARLALCGFVDVISKKNEEEIQSAKQSLISYYGKSVVTLFAESRNELARFIADSVTVQRGRNPKRIVRIFGDAAMHSVWGWPILAIVLFVMYQIVGVFAAGKVVNVIESVFFGEWILPFVSKLFELMPNSIIKSFLYAPEGAAGTGLLIGQYGLFSMGITYAIAIVLPVVFFFFLLFSIMEDTGYLPRLVVMLDKLFRRIGLNGRAVLPMILGLGCDTMATMTTRILPTKKERVLVTFLLALAVPCSAQLGVLAALAASLSARAIAVWFTVMLIVIFITGWIGSKIIPGKPAPMIFEIPPLRIPKISNIAAKTVARSEWYLREAVPLFILGTFFLWLLDALHLLRLIEKAMAPVVVGLLGLPESAARAFLMGFLRRDYGAAGLYDIFKNSAVNGVYPQGVEAQIIVSIVTITLFIPCVANFFVIGKERGIKSALLIVFLTTAIALFCGTCTRLFLIAAGWA